MVGKKGFTFAGIFAILIASLWLVSATTSSVFSISDVNAPASVSEDAGSFNFTFNLTYTGTSESKNFTFSDSTSTIGTVTIPDAIGLNGTAHESRIITGTVSGFAGQGGKSLTVIINASSGNSRDDETNFTVSITDVAPKIDSICSAGEVGSLEITDFNIDNLGEGTDDEWEPLDEIEMEVEVKNTNTTDSVRNVLVDIIIKDKNGNDVTSDFDIEDDEIDLGRIRDGDRESAIFKIKEVPADLEEGYYKIYFKAYSEDDEDLQCVSNSRRFNKKSYHEIEFVRNEDMAVIVKNPFDYKVTASCGDKSVEVSFPVYNIGVDKEKRVLVNLYNSELGIDKVEVIDDLRSGKKKDVSFFLDIPKNLTKNKYNLKVITFFDYNKNKDEMDPSSYDANSEDDLDESYKIPLEILTCSIPEPSINAELVSDEAMVDKELTIKAFITNNGNDGDFLITISGFEDWAKLTSDELKTLSIKEGETKELTITFVPTKEGLQSFNINAIVDGETYEQQVSVNIKEKEGFFSGLGIGKLELYLIIGIAILIVLILLILIIRAIRKPKAKL